MKNKVLELTDTISYMESKNYKERFKAEYYQLLIRYSKLNDMVKNWDNLDFKPTCPKSLYEHQLESMKRYKEVLDIRAELEDIDLKGPL